MNSPACRAGSYDLAMSCNPLQQILIASFGRSNQYLSNCFFSGIRKFSFRIFSLLLIVFFCLSNTHAQEDDYVPGFLGDRSGEGFQAIKREMAFWDGLGTLITWGSIVNLTLNDPEITAAQGGGSELLTAAEALSRLPEARRSRVNGHIDWILADDTNELKESEILYWEWFREYINSGEDGEHEGRDSNDPHIVTLDGLRYAFQAVGEYVLVRCNNGMFEIQTRQSPIKSNLAANSAVAMNVWGDRVCIYASGHPDDKTDTPIRINGMPVQMGKKPIALKNGGVIRFTQKKLNDIEVSWPSGERVLVYNFFSGEFKYLNLLISVPSGKMREYCGLLGDANTDPNDDLRLQNGKVLDAEPAYFEVAKLMTIGGRLNNVSNKAQKTYLKKLNKKFGDSWRVADESSLFDYKPGYSTASFTDRSFPDDYYTLGDLSTEQLRQARQTCEAEGVPAEEMEACVYDVAFSGYQGFAKSSAKMAQAVELIEDLGIRVPLKPFLPNNIEETLKYEAEKQFRKKIKFPKGKL